ncbi:MAG: hypothetical protein ACREXU_19285 [Gammaproteobacteria bacterium]
MAGCGAWAGPCRLLIGGCSAPERPALRFAHNPWPGYFPITLAREPGYYTREGVGVEGIYAEDQGPRIADFIAGSTAAWRCPSVLIVASGHHPDMRIIAVAFPNLLVRRG